MARNRGSKCHLAGESVALAVALERRVEDAERAMSSSMADWNKVGKRFCASAGRGRGGIRPLRGHFLTQDAEARRGAPRRVVHREQRLRAERCLLRLALARTNPRREYGQGARVRPNARPHERQHLRPRPALHHLGREPRAGAGRGGRRVPAGARARRDGDPAVPRRAQAGDEQVHHPAAASRTWSASSRARSRARPPARRSA